MKKLIKVFTIFSLFFFVFLAFPTSKSSAACQPTISLIDTLDGTINLTYHLSVVNNCGADVASTLTASVPASDWSYVYENCIGKNPSTSCPYTFNPGSSTTNLVIRRPVGASAGSYSITAGIVGSNTISLSYIVQQERWVCDSGTNSCSLQWTADGQTSYSSQSACNSICKPKQTLTTCPPGPLSKFAPAGIPTGGLCMVNNLIKIAVEGLLVISALLALFFLIIGGIKWITSGGDKSGVEGARKTLTYAIIGLIVALLSFMIINFIGGVFGVNYLGS